MDTSGLNVFSLSRSYKLQGFVSWIINLGKIKSILQIRQISVCRIATHRFNINVPLAACIKAAGGQAGICCARSCVCIDVPDLSKSGICLCGCTQLRNSW